jgi:hypothetical protein
LVFALLASLACGAAAAAAPTRVHVELNNLEASGAQCRVTFVVDNRAKESLDSLKLDLAVFNAQHIVQRRLIAELGPVRGNKTIVKTFALDGACNEIGSILVNDVTCTLGTPDVCLEGLELSSRLKDVKLFK